MSSDVHPTSVVATNDLEALAVSHKCNVVKELRPASILVTDSQELLPNRQQVPVMTDQDDYSRGVAIEMLPGDTSMMHR
jgi:hypothetical protein